MNTKIEHTPALWHILKAARPDNVGGYDYAILDQDGNILAEAYEITAQNVKQPARTNALVMAAAPELLAFVLMFVRTPLASKGSVDLLLKSAHDALRRIEDQ